MLNQRIQLLIGETDIGGGDQASQSNGDNKQ